jgi:hypothetical protein
MKLYPLLALSYYISICLARLASAAAGESEAILYYYAYKLEYLTGVTPPTIAPNICGKSMCNFDQFMAQIAHQPLKYKPGDVFSQTTDPTEKNVAHMKTHQGYNGVMNFETLLNRQGTKPPTQTEVFEAIEKSISASATEANKNRTPNLEKDFQNTINLAKRIQTERNVDSSTFLKNEITKRAKTKNVNVHFKDETETGNKAYKVYDHFATVQASARQFQDAFDLRKWVVDLTEMTEQTKANLMIGKTKGYISVAKHQIIISAVRKLHDGIKNAIQACNFAK